MKQITEDYCSFEIAQLLKEKGFPQYKKEEGFRGLKYNIDGKLTSAPYAEHYRVVTQSLALKWLREVHNWYIDIRFNRHYQYYIPIVYNMSGTLESIANLEERPKQYEQAVEAALLYVLKNLI